MIKRTIDFNDLRKKKGIGWKYFLWDLPKEVLGSAATGLTGGTRILQVGGLVAGLATAAGVATYLGVVVVSVAGGVFTVLGVGYGIFNLAKQSKDREKRIEKIVGGGGTVEKLKKQISKLTLNLASMNDLMDQLSFDDKEALHKILLSLHTVKGSTLKEKLYNLFGLPDYKNLAAEMSIITQDVGNQHKMESGIELLEQEYEASLNSVKQTVTELLGDIKNINFTDLYNKISRNEELSHTETEFRKKIAYLIKKIAPLPGENFYQKLGYLYDLDEESSKDLENVFDQLPTNLDIEYENFSPLNQAIKLEARSQYLDLLISLNNNPDNIAAIKKKMKTFEKSALSLLPGQDTDEKMKTLFDLEGREKFSKQFQKIANRYRPQQHLPEGAQTWGEILLSAKNTLDNYPHKKLSLIKKVLENGLGALVGSLSGFGIVVGIAGFAGIGIATGGIGLAVLIGAFVAAAIGAALFVAATHNTRERRKQFERDDNEISTLVDNTTKKIEILNSVMRIQINRSLSVFPQEGNDELLQENQRLRAENEALKKQLADQVHRSPENEKFVIFPQPRPGNRPPPPDRDAPNPPESPKSPKGGKG